MNGLPPNIAVTPLSSNGRDPDARCGIWGCFNEIIELATKEDLLDLPDLPLLGLWFFRSWRLGKWHDVVSEPFTQAWIGFLYWVRGVLVVRDRLGRRLFGPHEPFLSSPFFTWYLL